MIIVAYNMMMNTLVVDDEEVEVIMLVFMASILTLMHVLHIPLFLHVYILILYFISLYFTA